MTGPGVHPANPWLAIALADYEGHMAMPGIAQAQMLSGILADTARRFAPRSIAVLGCAGGNGFEAIDPEVTERVVGVDVNAEYVAQAQARHGGRFRSLELKVADIQTDALDFEPVDLMFAALVLEYVNVDAVIGRTRVLLAENGRLLTVLQMPCAASPKVTPSPFASLRALTDVMRLVAPEELRLIAGSHGLVEVESATLASAGGKQFQLQVFDVEN